MKRKFKIPQDRTLKGRAKNLVRPLFYWFKVRMLYYREILFATKMQDIKQIPIIINNYNRLQFLLQLIECLEHRGYSNIYLIDNASTYPPLLEYYNRCPYKVFRLEKNVGYLSLWQTDIYKQFIRGYYVYTDSDVLLTNTCPDNFMQYFYDLLQKYKYSSKIGFSLKIDDLPDHFDKKKDVLAWEEQYWKYEIEKGVYEAPIDTTFALYRPFSKGPANFYTGQMRVGYPYELKHQPWYNDSANLNDEECYYIQQSQTSTHWTKQL